MSQSVKLEGAVITMQPCSLRCPGPGMERPGKIRRARRCWQTQLNITAAAAIASTLPLFT